MTPFGKQQVMSKPVHAVWESMAQFRAAFTHPEFKADLTAYPSSVVAAPHLFQTVAVPGICVANDEIRPGIRRRLTGTARDPAHPPGIAQFLGRGKRLIPKVGVRRIVIIRMIGPSPGR